MSALEQTVPDGYKQTEVGVIPEDWEIDAIGNLLSITTGNKNTQDRVNDGLYPFFVRSQTVERINSFSFDGEGVLTAGDGVGTGKIFHYMNGKFDFHQRVYLMYNFGEKLDGYYFYIYFSNHFYDRIMSMTAKSSVDSVRREMIADMKVSLPPYNEQSAIANALSDVDLLLTELEKLIAKKQAIKTATMQQLLTGKTRLPQFTTYTEGEKQGQPKGTKASELGEIPEDWYFINIGNNAVLKARIGWQALTTKEYLDTGSKYLVTGTDFDAGEVNWNSCCFVSDWRYKQDTNIQLKENDVLITKDGTIGKVGFINELPLPATLNSGVFVVRPKVKSFYPKYLFYVLTSSIFKSFIKGITAGSTITHLYQKDFVHFEFPAPDVEEQTAIATILTDMDNEIQTLEQRLAKTRQIKQGMMQELLTGRTRLPFDKD